MIIKTEFKAFLKEICVLCGIRKPDDDQVELFYSKIKDYDLRDLKKAAADEELLSELARARVLIYPIIRRVVEKYMLDRQEKEEAIKKKQREREAVELLKSQNLAPQIKAFLKSL